MQHRTHIIKVYTHHTHHIYSGNERYRDCIAFAVYSNSQAAIDIMLASQELEEPSSGQFHNPLIYFFKDTTYTTRIA